MYFPFRIDKGGVMTFLLRRATQTRSKQLRAFSLSRFGFVDILHDHVETILIRR